MGRVFLGYPNKNIRKYIEGRIPDPYAVCFRAMQDNSSVGIRKNSVSAPTVYLEYSTNGINWTKFETTTTLTKVVLQKANDKVWFRAQDCGNSTFATSDPNSNRFSLTGKISASGSVMSLLDNSNESISMTKAWTFYALFFNQTALVKAPELPSKNVTNYGYGRMFSGTKITTTPIISLTSINDHGCYTMFSNCTELQSAQDTISATSVLYFGCDGMFSGCVKLKNAPNIIAKRVTSSCYANMFSGCTSLENGPEKLEAATKTLNCYNKMFYNCKSLTKAPEIFFSTVDSTSNNKAMQQMFYGCSSLNEIKVHFKKWPELSTSSSDLYQWTYGVSSSGTFYCPNELSDVRGCGNIPENWSKTDI